jgi:hypothetical protein
LVPDSADGEVPNGNWIQLAGALHDRRIVAFTLKTTTSQDDRLIRELNDRKNAERFNLLFRNCVDFAPDIVNFHYPKALRSSFMADLGLTAPKQIAKSLVSYGQDRSELQLSTFVIPEVPGSRPESRKPRGVLESLVKTKKYAIPLTVVEPWVPATLAAGYLVGGRFKPERYATTVGHPPLISSGGRVWMQWRNDRRQRQGNSLTGGGNPTIKRAPHEFS